MNRLARVLLYGTFAIALVTSAQLFRPSTPVAEAQCNNHPNHDCTRENENVNVSGGGVTDDGQRCNFQPNHACEINDNGPISDGDGNITTLSSDNFNDNVDDNFNDNVDDGNFNDNFDNDNTLSEEVLQQQRQ